MSNVVVSNNSLRIINLDDSSSNEQKNFVDGYRGGINDSLDGQLLKNSSQSTENINSECEDSLGSQLSDTDIKGPLQNTNNQRDKYSAPKYESSETAGRSCTDFSSFKTAKPEVI